MYLIRFILTNIKNSLTNLDASSASVTPFAIALHPTPEAWRVTHSVYTHTGQNLTTHVHCYSILFVR